MREARMPNGEPADDPGRDVLVQLERVRLRRNLYVVERALLLALALGAGAAALALPLALRTGALVFGALSALIVVAAGAFLVVVVRDLCRDWLTTPRAAAWTDDRVRLDGRLATFEALRRSAAARSPLFPVLIAQVRARLDDWSPARLVPNLVPPGPLAATLAAGGALIVVLLLTPDMLPQVPLESARREAPASPAPRAASAPRPDPVAAQQLGPDDGTGSETARGGVPWIASVQERLRRAAWGDDWARVRDALARAEAVRREREAAGGASVLPFGRTAAANRQGAEMPGAAGAGARGGTPTGEPRPSAGESRGSNPTSEAPRAAGTAAGGAGAGTDERLLADAPADVHPGGDTFPLAIAARVRARGGAPRPPRGAAPPLAPDARPALAHRRRPATPVHRMTVPPEYEPLVRRAFARATPPPEEDP